MTREQFLDNKKYVVLTGLRQKVVPSLSKVS